MKTVFKLALIGVALIGAAGAQAQVVTNNNDAAGGSSVLLFLKDNTTPSFLTLDLGLQVSSLKSAAQVIADGPIAPESGTFNASALASADLSNVTAWLSTRTSDSISYSIMGSEFGGSGNYESGLGDATGLLASSINLSSGVSHATNDQANTIAGFFNDFVTNLNTFVPASGVSPTAGWGGSLQSDGALAPTSWGANLANGGSLGSTLTLYLLATNGLPLNVAANAYRGAQVTLSYTLAGGAQLSVVNPTSTSAVPLPAAVWLFGSGLMGLAGIGRRRKAA